MKTQIELNGAEVDGLKLISKRHRDKMCSYDRNMLDSILAKLEKKGA